MEGWMAKKNKKNIVQPYMMKACKPRRTTAPWPPSASLPLVLLCIPSQNILKPKPRLSALGKVY